MEITSSKTYFWICNVSQIVAFDLIKYLMLLIINNILNYRKFLIFFFALCLSNLSPCFLSHRTAIHRWIRYHSMTITRMDTIECGNNRYTDGQNRMKLLCIKLFQIRICKTIECVFSLYTWQDGGCGSREDALSLKDSIKHRILINK